ncbi:MAG: hypothetical protein ACP5N2_03795 [Candidatus Nanoarchaeia archaeon]
MRLNFEDLRSERRSFFCPNLLWKELHRRTRENISVSSYIKQALLEKMEREDQRK